MKKYLYVASLFLLNCEVVSWIAAVALMVMGLVAFLKAAEREGAFK